MQIIPLPSGAAFFRQRVALDGVDFYIDLAWNGRAGTWALSLLDGDEIPLVFGMTAVTNRPMLRRYKHLSGMPGGDLIFMDLTQTIDAASYDQLGREIELVYFTAAEIAAGA